MEEHEFQIHGGMIVDSPEANSQSSDRLNHWLKIAAILAFFAIAFACVMGAMAAWELRQVGRSLRREVAPTAVSLRGTLSESEKALQETRLAADTMQQQAVLARSDFNQALSAAITKLDSRLGETNATLLAGEYNAVQQLAAANVTLADAANSLNSVTNQTAQIESQIGSTLSVALPQFFDCEQNAACLYSRWAAGSKAFIDTMGSIDKAAPQLAATAEANGKNIEGITGDMHALTSRLSQKRGFWGRLWEGAKVASNAMRIF